MLLPDVVVADEPAGPAHRDRVEDVEQVLRGQVIGVQLVDRLEMRGQAGEADLGELVIVHDEVRQQRVEIPERVVHRRRGQQHDRLRGLPFRI